MFHLRIETRCLPVDFHGFFESSRIYNFKTILRLGFMAKRQAFKILINVWELSEERCALTRVEKWRSYASIACITTCTGKVQKGFSGDRVFTENKVLNLNLLKINLGCISLGKILIRILNQKKIFFCLFGKIQKEDYESNESARDEDSVD